jgi:sec-independent protein translocase protein TatB
MLDIGWSEMAMIALLALIVIGPKDLPTVMRTIGQYTRKARMMARDFQSSLDDMMHESELDEARKTVEKARTYNPRDEFEREVDPDGSVRQTAAEFDREARDRGSEAGPQGTAQRQVGTGETAAGDTPASGAKTQQGERAGSKASGGKSGGSDTTGSKSAGAKTSGTKSAATKNATTKSPGSKSTGTKNSGTKSSGTKSSGTKSSGTKAAASNSGGAKNAADNSSSSPSGGGQSGTGKSGGGKAGGGKSGGAKSGGNKKADTTASS